MAKIKDGTIVKVSGRVKYFGTFKTDKGSVAAKISIVPEKHQREKFGEKFDIVTFEPEIKELLMDAHLKPDMTWEFRGKHCKKGDHVTASGPYREDTKKKGRKKYINRSLRLKREMDLVWTQITEIEGNPWLNTEDAENDPATAENSPI